MKTYKTWEVIKLLEEDSSLKFKNQENQIITIDHNNMIIIENRMRPLYSPEDVWTKIQEPVDFITAIKSYHNGKTIRCELANKNTRYSVDAENTCLKEFGNGIIGITSGEILNGIWYIEED